MYKMSSFVNVFIEIEKGSNKKYEWNHSTQKLELDRILPIQYKYPYPYGFIPNTLAEDGDELDALLITNNPYNKGTNVYGIIVGVLVMEDEKGMDEKILVLPVDDYLDSENLDNYDMDKMAIHQIEWFFSNYKKYESDKWSKVHYIGNKEDALQIYERSCAKYNSNILSSKQI